MLLFLLFIFLLSPSAFSLNQNQECLYLQTFKQSLHDPSGFFSGTWDPRDDTPCNWRGVTCSNHSSVTSLDLPDANLTGPFPAAALCALRHLSFISLRNNSINSALPGPDLLLCSSLSHLDLSENLLTGPIPPQLSSLPELRYLDLSGNNFSGSVPLTFAHFPKLEAISLVENLLDGEFPSFLTNVTTLRQLNLSYNPFKPSVLPPDLGHLIRLENLWLSECNLVGPIPDSIGRLTNLTDLDLTANALTGPIPTSITQLTSLVQIELYGNSLSGNLPPTGWANLASLLYFDASINNLTGIIPDELASLPLASLSLYQNRLQGNLPPTIADSPNLFELKVFSNRLTGQLPPNLGANSQLVLFDVSDNAFTGGIPPSLCSKGKLEELLMLHNSLSGSIPATLADCTTLRRVRLSGNRLSGQVPDRFWGLPHVSLLELHDNSLSGGISTAISSAFNLSVLSISDNRFTGRIPPEIGLLDKLVTFLGSGNRFSGSLPPSVVELDQLGRLDLHNNQLSGDIPAGINALKKLNDLNLARNAFSGEIPSGIGSLSVLNYLDLSGNKFYGRVPVELQNLKLNQFNLSDNRLSGPLPSSLAKESYKTSFLGNPGLCGDIPGLCDTRDVETRSVGYVWLLRFMYFLAGLVFVVGVSWLYWKYKTFNRAQRAIDHKSKWTLLSFHKLGFSEYEIMNCLQEDNVVGSGASGKVYKAVLSNGEAVAVKKLWGSSNKALVERGGDHDLEKGDDGFAAEVETLGRIRHKNIVRLWCCCVTRHCRFLVYEYMPNGSLGDVLHSCKAGSLDWPTRYRIALDSAEGLSYLHHDCVPPIVHRDVKSNNILLDGEFGARLADFGMAKVVDATGGNGDKSMSVIAGSCGYIAPEYAYTLRVNEKSDIYSFGVVILELITGKRPVDPEYGEKDLVKWVCTILDQKGVDHILDPKLDLCFKEEMAKVLDIGLHCTSPLPINRPSMRRVVKMLHEVSGENWFKAGNKDGKLSPYYCEDASDQGSLS